MAEQENIELENEVDQVEESVAANTLKPGASKSELLSQMLRVVGGMKKDDLSAFLKKTLDQVGKEDDSVPDTSGRNAASIAMKATSKPNPTAAAVKEDVEGLFSEQEDLSEEFKKKASTLFEAAVANRVSIESARLEEEFETKLEEQVSESIDELHTQVESYIDYVAEKWVEENRVAIETGYRTEMTENFIRGLKGLFEENYVDVPEEKVDLVGQMESRISELEESLEESSAENIRLSKEIHLKEQCEITDSLAEDLTDTQKEKFFSLAENLSFEDLDEYKEKLGVIKEEYFSETSSGESYSTGLINEDYSIGSNDEDESETVVIPEEMKNYVSAISRTIKK